MPTRPLSPRAQVGAAVITPAGIASVVLTAYGEKGVAIGVVAVTLLGLLLWLRLDTRRESTRPLVVDLAGRSARQEYASKSVRRIRVRNHSTRTVRSVHVELVEFTPQGADFLPVDLQRLNGGNQPFELHPGTDTYLDLVSLASGSDHYVLGYDMSRVEPGTSNMVRAQPLELVVRVSADEIVATDYTFAASVDAKGRLHLIETTEAPGLSPKSATKDKPVARLPTAEKSIILHALFWLADSSAWGRWQKAAHRKMNHEAGNSAGFTEEGLMHTATEVVELAIREGNLDLWGVPVGKTGFERIEPDVLRTRARLRIERDPVQLWRVSLGVSPKAPPEIAAIALMYDSLAVDMSEIRRLWPERERKTDRLTKRLDKEWTKIGSVPGGAKAGVAAPVVVRHESRRLSATQSAQIVQGLKGSTGNLVIFNYLGAHDADQLAADIAATFQRAGWQVERGPRHQLRIPPPTGIAIELPGNGAQPEPPMDDERVRELIGGAMAAAGIAFDTRDRSEVWSAHACVIIGHSPAPTHQG